MASDKAKRFFVFGEVAQERANSFLASLIVMPEDGRERPVETRQSFAERAAAEKFLRELAVETIAKIEADGGVILSVNLI
jgi:hypothetical protein